ncbi:hypothetical protein BU23DRAFT_57583 [Bimuria novae-zelandiae CBS 107.79]|uniref:Uncharacterized protein n=1 Tax=Bimuria novae-zelandiae CBS 107.79 TaxID=1447943 RepID=A0A6A5VHQ4_9PLEO|nr:hypothetical protein BU23DRAFT_57583 [Bimuria novae-zelandiae CBS 107.79]
MSASAVSDPVKESGAASKSKKKKNKKKGAKKAEEVATVNGSHVKQEEQDEDSDEDEEQQKPVVKEEPDDVEDEQPLSPTTAQANGSTPHSISSAVALGLLARSRSQQGLSPSPPPSDTSARLDAIGEHNQDKSRRSIEGRCGQDRRIPNPYLGARRTEPGAARDQHFTD